MLIGAIAMFAGGIGLFIFHHLRVAAIKSSRDKYEYISRREIKNLEIVRFIPEQNLLLVKGAIPGPTGGMVCVRASHKQ